LSCDFFGKTIKNHKTINITNVIITTANGPEPVGAGAGASAKRAASVGKVDKTVIANPNEETNGERTSAETRPLDGVLGRLSFRKVNPFPLNYYNKPSLRGLQARAARIFLFF
jgi:hypothetical protein